MASPDLLREVYFPELRWCVEPLLAADIATKSPDAIRAIKQLINRTWQQDPAPTLRLEAELQMAVMAGDNQREAALANMEKRPPVFRDPE